jgi:hypothetical protein
MAKLVWDQIGERRFETGIDHGVLYIPDANGSYVDGVAWNGLTAITEKPSGAEPNAKYADNIKYLSLRSAEQFGGTIEAITYPDEWSQFDGIAIPTPGVAIGQQNRRHFGLCYRTLVGNDIDGEDHAYKLHLVYGATASPSERPYSTVNDSPDTAAFSWDFDTQPVAVGVIGGVSYKPTALLTVISSDVDADTLVDLERMLYGDVAVDPALPLPSTVIGMFSGVVVEVAPNMPGYVQGTHTLTIPNVVGVTYFIEGEAQVAGPQIIAADTLVTAQPNPGYVFPEGVDNDWLFVY